MTNEFALPTEPQLQHDLFATSTKADRTVDMAIYVRFVKSPCRPIWNGHADVHLKFFFGLSQLGDDC